MTPATNTCRCDDERVVAYRDEDGDWACTLCGRHLGRRPAALLNAQARASSVTRTPSSPVPQPALRAKGGPPRRRGVPTPQRRRRGSPSARRARLVPATRA
jgi:hypothetical protein